MPVVLLLHRKRSGIRVALLSRGRRQ